MLQDIKVLLDIPVEDTSKDTLLNVLYNKCSRDVMNYCNIDEIPDGLTDTVEELVIIRYNRRGNEGADTETVGPLTTTYIEGADAIPESFKPLLNRYRRAKFR